MDARERADELKYEPCDAHHGDERPRPWRSDCSLCLESAIRAAENDALERAATEADAAATGHRARATFLAERVGAKFNLEAYDHICLAQGCEQTAARIRSLKTGGAK